MSAPVNVLAVLNGATLDAGGDEQREELEAATSAVADLIEAAQKAHAFLKQDQWGKWSYMEGSEVYDDLNEEAARLRAAIARCTGEGA